MGAENFLIQAQRSQCKCMHVHAWSPPDSPRTVTSPGVTVALGLGHSVDWAMSLLTELGSTKSLLYIAGFLDLRVKFSFAVCFDKVGRVFDDAFALWKRKMKCQHPEGQRSIQVKR